MISGLNFKIVLLLILFILSCAHKNTAQWTEEKSPDYFVTRFETTRGNFDTESRREWSPEGVDRFYQLVKSGFYTNIAIFRVITGYVAQFGIHNDSTLNNSWERYILIDEPVIEKNYKGTIAFARAGENSRSTQLYINLANNSPRLDTLAFSGVPGFPVVARIISGIEIIERFYSEYGARPGQMQDSIYAKGNSFLQQNFPDLDYITKACILPE